MVNGGTKGKSAKSKKGTGWSQKSQVEIKERTVKSRPKNYATGNGELETSIAYRYTAFKTGNGSQVS